MNKIDRTLSVLGLDRDSAEGRLIASHLARQTARDLFQEAGAKQVTDAELATDVRRMAAATDASVVEESIACILVDPDTGHALARAQALHRHAAMVLVLPKSAAGDRLGNLSAVGVAGRRYVLVAKDEGADHVRWTVKGLRPKNLKALAKDQGEATLTVYWQATS